MSAVPGEPRSVKLQAINSTAIGVQWRPPVDDDKNGVIRGYQIYYAVNDDAEGLGRSTTVDIMNGKTLVVRSF